MLFGIVIGVMLCVAGFLVLLFHRQFSSWMKQRFYKTQVDIFDPDDEGARPGGLISSRGYSLFVGIATLLIGIGMIVISSTW